MLLRPQALGGPAAYLVVRGDSMLPTYQSGDLLILHSASGYAIGDVVAYLVPKGEFGEGHLVVHRIVGGDASAGFVLEGDNNPAPDPWQPKPVDVVGRPWIAIPKVGAVVAWARQPLILGALAASLAVAFIVSRPTRSRRLAIGDAPPIGVRWGVHPRAPRPT
ncbi:MAG TPA: signal peptidase I [Candidatus Limnocylindrales bacterium]|nr:signal peptidase I [Candidatus Limnocylindrales bacterium]